MGFTNSKPTVTVVCTRDGCAENLTYDNHRWDTIRSESGWLLQRNGDTWCPKHHPEWAAEWRAKKTRNKMM